MADQTFVLNERSRNILRDITQWWLRRTASRLPHSKEEEVSQAPETFVAYVPTGGIPRMTGVTTTGTGTGTRLENDVPGSAECEIYELVKEEPPFLVPIGKKELVYNLSTEIIAGDQWIPISRERFGGWLALHTAGGGGTEIEQTTLTYVKDVCLDFPNIIFNPEDPPPATMGDLLDLLVSIRPALLVTYESINLITGNFIQWCVRDPNCPTGLECESPPVDTGTGTGTVSPPEPGECLCADDVPDTWTMDVFDFGEECIPLNGTFLFTLSGDCMWESVSSNARWELYFSESTTMVLVAYVDEITKAIYIYTVEEPLICCSGGVTLDLFEAGCPAPLTLLIESGGCG